MLVDGGVLNPLPLNLITKKEDALLLAVDLNAKGNKLIKDTEKTNKTTKWFENVLFQKIS